LIVESRDLLKVHMTTKEIRCFQLLISFVVIQWITLLKAIF
jgi:hypothetical protein